MKLWTNADFEALRKGLDTGGQQRRHEVRYACFRVQNERKGGAKAEDAHHEIAREIESLPGFGGWERFAITWDVSTPEPIVLVERKWSIYQEHDQLMRRVAVPLPGLSDE